MAALQEERFIDAAEAFTRVQHAMPGEIAVALMVANAWRLSGNSMAERDALSRAYRESIDVADVATLFQLGAALLDAGIPTEARRCFERVVRQRPRDPAALGALAGATRADGDPLIT